MKLLKFLGLLLLSAQAIGADPKPAVIWGTHAGSSAAIILPPQLCFSDGTCQSTAGGGGGSQTPWTSDIDGGGFNLSNVNDITATGTLSTDSGQIFTDGAGNLRVNGEINPGSVYSGGQGTFNGGAQIANSNLEMEGGAQIQWNQSGGQIFWQSGGGIQDDGSTGTQANGPFTVNSGLFTAGYQSSFDGIEDHNGTWNCNGCQFNMGSSTVQFGSGAFIEQGYLHIDGLIDAVTEMDFDNGTSIQPYNSGGIGLHASGSGPIDIFGSYFAEVGRMVDSSGNTYMKIGEGPALWSIATDTPVLSWHDTSGGARALEFFGSGSEVVQQSGDIITALGGSKYNLITSPTISASDISSGTFVAARMPAFTGDITTSAGAVATTLATVNSNVGSFTNASVTVNAKGLVTAAASGAAPVTSVSVASANGFAGSSSGGATPALTLSTSITGVLKGNGTAISAATSGTDYAPGTSALTTGILKSTTSTGALTIATSADIPSPLTTKGDTLIYSTSAARQAVPGDYGNLVPDSTQTNGWRAVTYTQSDGRSFKNYIQYADFENNSTTGWTLGTVGTLTNGLPTGTPTFGSGASGNLSIASQSSGPLSQTYSLGYVSSAATTAGNMVASSSIPIDISDQARVLGVNYKYKANTNPSNGNFSGTSSNSYAWAVYDVTNSSWLTSWGNFCTVQSFGVGNCSGGVQTNSNTANIRFVLYNANATSGALTLYLDDFYVGPQVSVNSPSIGDWVSYTPTIVGFGSATLNYAQARRIGDSIQIQASFTAGTPTAVTGTFSLPSVSADSSISSITPVGHFGRSGTSATFQSVLVNGNPSGAGAGVLTFGRQDGSNAMLSSQTGSNVVAGGETVTFTTLPFKIAGWSSNAVSSSDTDTRVIAESYGLVSNVSPGANAVIKFDTLIKDTAGMYSPSTGLTTIPVSGVYTFSAVLYGSAGGNSYISVNGTPDLYVSTIGNNVSTSGSVTRSFNAGDTVGLFTDTSLTITGNTAPRYLASFSLARLSGPAVVQATESVNAKYYALPSTMTGSLSTMVWSTKDWDTHAGMSSGVYTVPVSGKYLVNTQITTQGTFVLNNDLDIQVQQNTVAKLENEIRAPGAVGNLNISTSGMLNCLAGDQVRVQASNSGTTPSVVSSNTENFFSIVRVGN